MRFAPGVRRFALPAFGAAAILAIVAPPLSLPALAVGVFVAWFFRDPDRRPSGPGVVSSADGRVSVVREDGDQLRVGVYMSATDVHGNRGPFPGRVERVTHRPGANKPAFSKESDRNERVEIDCGEYELSLIAGWFARRIHPYVAEGDSIERGEKVGHISFGSRVDVLLPERVAFADLRVTEGEDVTAGETVVAVDPGE
jgi:phosphatidylserine decarboxylase